LGRVFGLLGNYPEALAMFEKGRELAGDMSNILAATGEILARSGDHDRARRLLGQLTARAEKEFIPATGFAIIHLGLGEREEALQCLEKAYDQHALPLASLNVHPIYDDLRGDAHFTDLLRRLRFPV
jgi:serine/threonine-protein kinase